MTEDDDAFVTIGRFWETSQPLFLKSVLEAHGIVAYVAGEYLGNISGTLGMFTGQARGGIELKVHAEDVAEAEAILNGSAEEMDDEDGEEDSA